MKKILNFMFNRMVIVGLLILFQIGILISVIWKLSNYFIYFYIICVILSMVVVLHLISKDENPSYKLAWAIPIMVFSIF